MKKLIILSALVTILSAEEPSNDSLNLVSMAKTVEEQATANAEELARNEIDSFFEDDEAPVEFILSEPAEEMRSQQIGLPEAKELKDLSPKESITIMKNDSIKLEADSPVIVEKSLDVAPVSPATSNPEVARSVPMTDTEMAQLEAEVNGSDERSTGVMIDLGQVFAGSPTIYTVLILLSVGSFCVWLYSLFSLRTSDLMPADQLQAVREKLMNREYDAALSLCQKSKNILFQMVASGLMSRSHGQNVMIETMKSEGRRASSNLWQKIALLNDVAMIAPMLGLLGTVLGMFYAFYDLNRSMESISALFDGLGISVGTTVGGLIVAILAMMFHAITKYRLVRQLTLIENEAQVLANLIDTKE